jgi:hypothetical protein
MDIRDQALVTFLIIPGLKCANISCIYPTIVFFAGRLSAAYLLAILKARQSRVNAAFLCLILSNITYFINVFLNSN